MSSTLAVDIATYIADLLDVISVITNAVTFNS